MPRIRILTPDVVNQIAAGEVIERPASVVKELVENALDAGSGHVTIDIEEGGRKLVRVADDGGGMERDDLPLAFHPHATSKLASADDLFRVSSFGFRGEALASIGAVSRTRIVSRVRGALEGHELVLENGKMSEVRPAASPEGTTVEVRNLFQNVPVRRKFLRAIDVELDHILETVQRFAIAHPKVRFDLRHDGAPRLTLPPEDRRTRIGRFLGKDVEEALLEVKADLFDALIAPPKFARTTIKSQYVYLNGRFIRDRVLSHAIQEAYRETVPHGRFAVAFLFLDLPPGEVDVNVHPTKIEVRFRQVWKVHDLLVSHLRKALLESDLAVEVRPEPPAAPAPYREMVEFFTRDAGPVSPLPSAPPLLTTGRRYFQVHDRYIIEEADDGIRVLDQHALHERFLLERFRKEYASADVARQRLLLPAALEVGEADRGLLESHREVLESLGLEFDDFGPRTVAVRAVPALLRDEDPATLMRDLLEKLREHGESERKLGEPMPLLDEALEFLACRGAIKFGRKLAPEELERLIADAADLDYSATCAHGRPTAIKLTLDELERLFKRK